MHNKSKAESTQWHKRSVKLACLYINAQSVINKMDYLQATITAKKPDVIGVTESWGNDKVFDSELHIAGYDLFRCDRPNGRAGGGVLLYTLSSLRATEFKTKTKFPEQIWCRLKLNNKDCVIVGVCYRTPNESIFGSENHALLREMITEISNQHFLLMGDFNYPGIQWNESSQAGQSKGSVEAKLFEECIDDNFITQHVNVPTRNDSILDLVFTREPEMINSIEAIEKFGNADHFMLKWDVEVSTVTESTQMKIKDYNKADYKEMKQDLSQVKWSEKLSSLSTEEAWNIFKQLLSDTESKHIPLKVRKLSGKVKPLWLTHKAINKVNKKHKVFRK